ncbi:MAG: type II toxin-antitoxin system VapB family antitoxin [Dehalococcoidia bacterium]|nr:type II toxin-antitoxin system VapB family antitoxin [Dehalococcoidia bacterium]
MRTTLDLDEGLLDEAKRISNSKTKKAVIEEALRELIAARRREELIASFGRGGIEMTLEELLRWRRGAKMR